MKFKMYQVGGCVRDEILGFRSKDIDYSVVCDSDKGADEVYNALVKHLENDGFDIFLQTPECFTIRAKKNGETADYVLARKELGYLPGTRNPIVVLGTLHDDLIRRDFTINALAKDENGQIIDLFGGLNDLSGKLIKTPLPALETMMDDPLRLLRALRFSIKYEFYIDEDIVLAMRNDCVIDAFIEKVSQERIREELGRMLQWDTKTTIRVLNIIPRRLFEAMFDNNLWLKPTFEKRKNG